MRFLHTSDWHVGKTLRGVRRDAEYQEALQEVVRIGQEYKVDCLLVGGDLFDSIAPAPEAELAVYEFFRELVAARIPAVVIGGNHDHPRRLNAIGNILELLNIRIRGEPAPPDAGGIIEVGSRDGAEMAVVAALPWVSEKKAREWESLVKGGQGPFMDYAEEVALRMEDLSGHFRRDAVNILLAHVMIDGASAGGDESGERPLHIGQTYAVNPQRLPSNAHYVALGHLHRRQKVGQTTQAYYSGSLLQLDFGEANQPKSVWIIEATAGQPARVEAVALTAGKRLQDVRGSLEELRSQAVDMPAAYLRVFVQVDGPFAGLAEQVREILPGAVAIIPEYPGERTQHEETMDHKAVSPSELFSNYYRQQHGGDVPPPLLGLFQRLFDRVAHETPAS